MRWWQKLNPMAHLQSMRDLASIHSTDDFRLILERERARTDRTGHDFSLVVFGIGSASGSVEMANRFLATILKKRSRNSDAIGWFDANALGTILPGTPAEGAWKFAETVRQAAHPNITLLHATVYSYPTTWIGEAGATVNKESQVTNVTSISGGTVSARVAVQESPKPVQHLEPVLRRRFPMWKDTLDVVGALIGLILLSPVFLLIGLFIKVVSPGPVFFKQTRIGYKGRPFTFWKFRTMHVNNDASQHQQYLSTLISAGDQPMTKLDEGRDPRIIPFGKPLRQSCIDELPQLINVLLGDMSLVGPRPCLPNEADEYNLWHTARFDTIPGMTGMWQVNGKNKTTFKQMMRYDISYTRQTTLFNDIKIILKTIPVIFLMVYEQIAAKRAARKQVEAEITVPRRA